MISAPNWWSNLFSKEAAKEVVEEVVEEVVKEDLISKRAKNLALAKRDNGAVRLDVCGGITPHSPAFNNIDILPESHPDFVMNIAQGIEFPDCSVDEIVSVATLEHFTYREFLFVISEMERVLKIGGKVSISAPDIEKIARRIVDGGMETEYDLLNQYIFALQRDPYDIHKVALSGGLLVRLLQEAGFEAINPEDTTFDIRHDTDLSFRVSATKRELRDYNPWLSNYKNEDRLLALAIEDRIRISKNLKAIHIYLPDGFPITDQTVVIVDGEKRQDEIKLELGLTYIPLVEVEPGVSYREIRFLFKDHVIPSESNMGSDIRPISAFLVLGFPAEK